MTLMSVITIPALSPPADELPSMSSNAGANDGTNTAHTTRACRRVTACGCCVESRGGPRSSCDVPSAGLYCLQLTSASCITNQPDSDTHASRTVAKCIIFDEASHDLSAAASTAAVQRIGDPWPLRAANPRTLLVAPLPVPLRGANS